MAEFSSTAEFSLRNFYISKVTSLIVNWMASVQSKKTKPEIPPKLKNVSSVCYCNALFQCLFNNDGIWNAIQDINENDQLKKISNSFSEASGRYHGINLLPLYQTFRPFINIRNADSGHSQHDPSKFLAAIINNYRQLKPIVCAQESTEHGLDSLIAIDPDIQNIQEGLSKRVNIGEFTYAPPLLCIKIERISAEGINMKSIEINNSLVFNATQEDGSQLIDKYDLESILCHRNITPKCGHFIAIVKKSNKSFYCDDSNILDGYPQNSSINAIKTKSYMLFYRKTDIESSHEEFFSINPASRLGTTKRREEMATISDHQQSSISTNPSLNPEHQIRRIPQIQFPVTSKEQKKTKPIAIELNGEIGTKEISESPTEYIEIKECKEENHDCIQRINLHEEFKYIYGYLDVNGKETIDVDYVPDDPIYTKHAALLEKFVSIICDFVFVVSADNGLINANTTAEVLDNLLQYNSFPFLQSSTTRSQAL